MTALEELREKVVALKDAEITNARRWPFGSERRLMFSCRADGMLAALALLDTLIQKEVDHADDQ